MLVMHVTPETMKRSFCCVKKHGTPSKKLVQTNVGTTIYYNDNGCMLYYWRSYCSSSDSSIEEGAGENE